MTPRESSMGPRLEDRVREAYRADPETGEVYSRKFGCKLGRNISGRFSKCIHMYIDGTQRTIMRSRVVWFLSKGEWPKGRLVHINGDCTDDRLDNLKDVPKASRYVGVIPRRSGKWSAQIKYQNRQIHIGLFETEDEANEAYQAFARKLRPGHVNAEGT